MNKKLVSTLLFILLMSFTCLGWFSPALAQPQTTTLTPMADAYVEEVNPNRNFAEIPYLEVADAADEYVKIKYAYIKFDLSGIQRNSTIDSAQLRLRAFKVEETHSIGVHYCSNTTWAEAEITWNNKPTFDVDATYTVTISGSGYETWDLTEDVQLALSQRKLTVVIKSEDKHDAGYVRFYSREETGYEPILRIEWTPPPTPPPPPPPPDDEPPMISGVEYLPLSPTPNDEVTVTCSVIDILHIETYSFDAEIGLNWTVLAGNWTVEDGELSQSQTDVDPETAGRQKLLSLYPYTDFVLVAEVKIIAAGSPGPHVGFVFRYMDSDNFYEFMLRGGQRNDVYFQKKVNGEFSTLGYPGSLAPPMGEWFTIKIVVSGSSFRGYVNNVLVAEASDDSFSTGQLGMSAPFTYVHFDDVEISLLDGAGVKEVNLKYRVDEGSWNKVAMEGVGDSNYVATIPKQEDGATVDWYIEAVDLEERKAETKVITYVVRALQIPWTMIGIAIAGVIIIAAVGVALWKGYIKVKVE